MSKKDDTPFFKISEPNFTYVIRNSDIRITLDEYDKIILYFALLTRDKQKEILITLTNMIK